MMLFAHYYYLKKRKDDSVLFALACLLRSINCFAIFLHFFCVNICLCSFGEGFNSECTMNCLI